MMDWPILDEREWRLVLEVLENERRDLPAEIRHTDRQEVRNELLRREKMLDSLIERLHNCVGSV